MINNNLWTTTYIDGYGNLEHLTEGKHYLNKQEIEAYFCFNKSRKEKFSKFLNFFDELKKHFTILFIIMDGSFITKKPEINDIDVAIGIPYEESKGLIRMGLNFFTKVDTRMPISRVPEEKYSVNSFPVPVYPQAHINRKITDYYIDYWEDWFSKLTVTIDNIRIPKNTTLKKGIVYYEFD